MTSTIPSPLTSRRLKKGNTILFSLITFATIGGIPLFAYFYDFHTIDWILFCTLYIASGLGITVGYHRLITHRSFTTPPWVKRFLLIFGGWALENSALRWGADHIRHHAQCDNDPDPYNAQRGFWFSHCGWIFYQDPYRHNRFASRLEKDPIVMWQNHYYLPIVLSGLLLPLLVGLIAHGWIGGIGCFLLAGVGRIFFVLNSTFCINSVCHRWGTQPYGDSDSSRNSWWTSLITFGEGYHNYHHMYPTDYRNGIKWYHIDPSKWLIYALSLVGLASALRRAPIHSVPSTHLSPRTTMP